MTSQPARHHTTTSGTPNTPRHNNSPTSLRGTLLMGREEVGAGAADAGRAPALNVYLDPDTAGRPR
jgi:hypothetical protein